MTRVGGYNEILPEPSGNPLGSALGISCGLRQYFIVYPSSRHNTVTIRGCCCSLTQNKSFLIHIEAGQESYWKFIITLNIFINPFHNLSEIKTNNVPCNERFNVILSLGFWPNAQQYFLLRVL